MLKKLLKYDIKAVGRIWWILATVVVGMSLAGSVVLRFIIETEDNESMALFWILGLLFLVACFICIIGSIIVTYVLVFWRYYQHLFTDEGYLTFTLPVKRRDILLSKTINSVLWITLHTILLVVCAGIFMLIAPPAPEGMLFDTFIFDGIGGFFSIIMPQIGWWSIALVLDIILLTIASAFFTTCLIQLCITIGAIVAKKAKVVAAIGIYYLANMIISTVVQIGGIIGTLLLESGIDIVMANATANQWFGVVSLALLIVAVMITTFTATIYFATQGILARKLNLS